MAVFATYAELREWMKTQCCVDCVHYDREKESCPVIECHWRIGTDPTWHAVQALDELIPGTERGHAGWCRLFVAKWEVKKEPANKEADRNEDELVGG